LGETKLKGCGDESIRQYSLGLKTTPFNLIVCFSKDKSFLTKTIIIKFRLKFICCINKNTDNEQFQYFSYYMFNIFLITNNQEVYKNKNKNIFNSLVNWYLFNL